MPLIGDFQIGDAATSRVLIHSCPVNSVLVAWGHRDFVEEDENNEDS